MQGLPARTLLLATLPASGVAHTRALLHIYQARGVLAGTETGTGGHRLARYVAHPRAAAGC
jgi:hypothetical protein